MNEPRTIGRYRIFDEIASGGMGTVHFGRMSGAAGFARTVAIKRLHPQFSKSPEFVEGLIDEARVAARIRHPNVVATLDVLAEEGEMLLVMEYVEGVTLSHLMRDLGRDDVKIPVPIAVGMMTGALYGLHAAHEAVGEDGVPLEVVHRDVSPQNIIVGVDGVARVVDFGVAKAVGRLQTTTDGRIKGKIAYMPPEQLRGRPVDRRADVYAAGVVLWELLSGKRLFKGDSGAETMTQVLELKVSRVGATRPEVPAALDDIIGRAMQRELGDRTPNAREMAVALEATVQPASTREIGEWLASVARDTLAERRAIVASIESASASGRMPVPPVSSSTAARQEPLQTADALSNIEYTVGITAAVTPRKSRRFGVIALAGASLLVLVGAGAYAVSKSHAKTEPISARTAPPPAEPTVPLPSASVAPVAPPPVPLAVSVSAPAPSAPPAPKPAPKPKVDCTTPFTLDASGARHWKKGC